VTLDAAARAALQRDLGRLADGDRQAFDPVFAALWPLLRSLGQRYLPAADAEDAAQRGLLRIFERASDFDPRRDALAWAIGLAIWEIRSVRRRRWRRRETTEVAMPERSDGGPSPEERVIAEDLASALGETLGTLAGGDVEALLRHARDERPAGAAFRKRLQRARQRVREAWRQRHG
jgi:RNA polymerase sigma-70 factor (ECF subfamily)